MKYLLLTTGLAIILAAQPAQAGDAAKSQDATKAETMHAPTNRVGDMVPTMTAPSNKDDATSELTDGEKSAETLHPPTNRVGDEVPTMKSAENEDDRAKSTTTGGNASSN